jgi:pimeloyl-ACP methyl ester carboxylesterase
VDELAERAPRWVWRSLHPLAREGFDDGGSPPALDRLQVVTDDGWRLPIGCVAPGPGGAGEPVLLLHTLGMGPDSFRYGRATTMVERLRQRGFACYLPAWRGDREATAPSGVVGGSAASFGGVVEHDLPAIVAAVCAHARARRVLIVGHGLGGLAALGWAALRGTDSLAGIVTLAAPVRFPSLPPLARAGLGLAARLPAPVPARRLARLAAVCMDPSRGLAGAVSAPGPRLRGGLVHAAEDVPVGLLDQLVTWCDAGALVDGTGLREYGVALRGASAPLLLMSSEGDRWCPPDRVRPLAEVWGGTVSEVAVDGHLGHLELLLHPEADKRVFRPVSEWLAGVRGGCWESAELAG